MNIWTNVSLAHHWALLLLLLAPLVWWLWYRQRDRRYPQLRMSSLQSLEGYTSWRARLRDFLPWLRGIAMVLLVLALARPQRHLQEEKITSEGIDIVLALDLSTSMLAQDFRPNRLEVSKRVAIDFVQKRPYDRVGLVAFAAEAFTPCPLTSDHSVVRTFIGSLACGALDDGTDIGQGLATAINRVKDSEAVSKVVILLTDGVNKGSYLSPEKAAEIAAEFGIKVYTIGVGTQGEALVPVARTPSGQYRYDIAKVEIDELLLQQIAKTTGGQYFRADSPEKLADIYNLIDQLEKTEIESTIIRKTTEVFRYFALLAACLVLLELILRYTILRAIP